MNDTEKTALIQQLTALLGDYDAISQNRWILSNIAKASQDATLESCLSLYTAMEKIRTITAQQNELATIFAKIEACPQEIIAQLINTKFAVDKTAAKHAYYIVCKAQALNAKEYVIGRPPLAKNYGLTEDEGEAILQQLIKEKFILRHTSYQCACGEVHLETMFYEEGDDMVVECWEKHQVKLTTTEYSKLVSKGDIACPLCGTLHKANEFTLVKGERPYKGAPKPKDYMVAECDEIHHFHIPKKEFKAKGRIFWVRGDKIEFPAKPQEMAVK